MLCKTYNFNPEKKVEIKELYNEEGSPMVMPSIQIEDKNGKEIFLYDVLLDSLGNGWVVYFHDKGYVCLVRIGSTFQEEPVPIMDRLGEFGSHYYSLPMEVVGNKYVDQIEDSKATPVRNEKKFKEYLKKIGKETNSEKWNKLNKIMKEKFNG